MKSIKMMLKRRGTGIIIASVALIVAFIICLTTNVIASDSYSNNPFHVVSVTIEEGDTLWNIASTYYTKEYKSLNHYIEVIKESNHMKDEYITIGMNIIVPYYEELAEN